MTSDFETGINIENPRLITLREIKKAGFKNVMPNKEKPDFEKSIKDAQDLGLNIPFAHASFMQNNFLWTDGAESVSALNEQIETLKICGDNNIKNVVLHPAQGTPSQVIPAPDYKGYRNFSELFAAGKSFGVDISIENTSAESMSHLRYLLSNFKESHIGFCGDIGHNNLYNPNEDLLAEFNDRLKAVHLHGNFGDWEKGMDFKRDLHLIPFTGEKKDKINYKKTAENIAKSGYTGALMYEVYKNTVAEDYKPYKSLSNEEFLKKTHKSASIFSSMVKDARNSLDRTK